MTIKDQNGQVLLKSNYNNSYTYTGRRYDEESGLYYYRNRMYSAELGRFISKDPKGYVDGMNLYAYVKNNPLKFLNPMGTRAVLTASNPSSYEYVPFSEGSSNAIEEFGMSLGSAIVNFPSTLRAIGDYADSVSGYKDWA